MAKQRYKRECMLMNYPQSIVFINIRYTFIFYFPKIFCPNFSVKNLFIHRTNILSDLHELLSAAKNLTA